MRCALVAMAALVATTWSAAAAAHERDGAAPETQSAASAALGPGLAAMLDAGEGLRSPDARSLGDSEETPYTEILTYETGLRVTASDAASAMATTFGTATGLRQIDAARGVQLPVAATGRFGVGLQLELAPTPWLSSSWNVVYTGAAVAPSGVSGPVDDSALSPIVPELVGRVEVVLTKPLGRARGRKLEGSIALAGIAQRDASTEDALDVDAKIAVRWGSASLELEAAGLLVASWRDGALVEAAAVGSGAPLDAGVELTLELP